jgi:ATP-binding cassette subfamily B (MDR/TAP) protein 6
MPTALQLIEVITPSVLSLFTALLAAPPRPAPPELPGIRAITVRTVMPRRRWILLALVVLAATCASEAVLLIVDLITARYRDPAEQHGRSPWFVAAGGAHALGGLAVYSLAAIFAEYRLRWGDKTLVALALTAWGLEVPYLVLSVIREVHAGELGRRDKGEGNVTGRDRRQM